MNELMSECFVTAVFCACEEVCIYFCLLYLVLAYCCTGILTLAILTFSVGAVGKIIFHIHIRSSVSHCMRFDVLMMLNMWIMVSWDVIVYFGR